MEKRVTRVRGRTVGLPQSRVWLRRPRQRPALHTIVHRTEPNHISKNTRLCANRNLCSTWFCRCGFSCQGAAPPQRVLPLASGLVAMFPESALCTLSGPMEASYTLQTRSPLSVSSHFAVQFWTSTPSCSLVGMWMLKPISPLQPKNAALQAREAKAHFASFALAGLRPRGLGYPSCAGLAMRWPVLVGECPTAPPPVISRPRIPE